MAILHSGFFGHRVYRIITGHTANEIAIRYL